MININASFTNALVIILLLLPLSLGAACASRFTSTQSKPSNQEGAAAEHQSSPETVKSPLPPPTGFINDYANVFDRESKERLELVLTELRDKTEIEFAVVTIETTGEKSIFDYSLAVAKGWGVGPKDTSSKGGGLLLMMALKDRQWRLQVSRSLEKDLPDEVSKQLGDQSRELYKQGKYAEGIAKYVQAIIERLGKVRGFELANKAYRPDSRARPNKRLQRG